MMQKNNNEKHLELLEWAKDLKVAIRSLPDSKSSSIKTTFLFDLKKYFALCALSRSSSANSDLVNKAYKVVFNTRVKIENSISQSIVKSLQGRNQINHLFSGSFFGKSNKQGVSLRLPLNACEPTSLCSNACYAHDVLDASPNAVLRGAINGVIANTFEEGSGEIRIEISKLIIPHIFSAVKAALNELENLDETFSRVAFIRFSHVGEIAAYPIFANYLAQKINEISNSKVRCVTYSRSSKAKLLNPNLWVLNFTIDEVSKERIKKAPSWARIVYSAWNGEAWDGAEVNFLEHHRWSHSPQLGDKLAKICPATLPQSTNRTCDGNRCDICFRPSETQNNSDLSKSNSS
jgi:hypothetical protein